MRVHKTTTALLLAAAAFALATSATATAATITVDGAGMREVRLWDSTSLAPAGSRVLVGYFDGLSDAQIVSNQLNTTFLQSKWVPFGLGGQIGQGVGGAAGYFTFDTTARVEDPAPSFTAPDSPSNDQIYVWIFNSSVAPTSATQQAIFTIQSAVGTIFSGGASGASDEWRWPVSDDGFTDRSISTDDSLAMLVGTSNANALYMNPVPEAGSCALLGIGMLAMVASRRRPARK